jgi:hypothetical protein
VGSRCPETKSQGEREQERLRFREEARGNSIGQAKGEARKDIQDKRSKRNRSESREK